MLIPDILKGDPFLADKGTETLEAWFPKHTPEVTTPIFEGFLSGVRKEMSPKYLVGIGYCFGGKYVIKQLNKSGFLDAGAVAHPTFVAEEEVEEVAKPLLISSAQIDPLFTTELRHKTEEILSKKETPWEMILFSQVSHGYSIKGDISIPQVKYAKEKTVTDQLTFLGAHAPN